MPINVYLLNRTYIAQDSATGLMAYAETEQVALTKLTEMLAQYWDKKKVIVPVNQVSPESDVNTLEKKILLNS